MKNVNFLKLYIFFVKFEIFYYYYIFVYLINLGDFGRVGGME